MDVHSCTAIALKKHPNTIGLVSPVRTFYLQAESQAEVQEWITAIESARQALEATSTQSSLTNIPTSHRASVEMSSPFVISPPPPSHPYITSSESDDGFPTANFPTSSPQPQSAMGSPHAKVVGASPKDSSKTVLSGYLMKCGSKRRNWRKRWFVLNGEKLVYSASHMVSRSVISTCITSPQQKSGYQTASRISFLSNSGCI